MAKTIRQFRRDSKVKVGRRLLENWAAFIEGCIVQIQRGEATPFGQLTPTDLLQTIANSIRAESVKESKHE